MLGCAPRTQRPVAFVRWVGHRICRLDARRGTLAQAGVPWCMHAWDGCVQGELTEKAPQVRNTRLASVLRVMTHMQLAAPCLNCHADVQCLL
jgi:hypothetical protein